MKNIIYVYLLDTVAEWEITYVTQAMSMQSMLKDKSKGFEVKTTALTSDSVKTLGGLTIIPDCTLDSIDENQMACFLLPGSNMWHKEEHAAVLQKAVDFINKGVLVGAICGSTLSLAKLGILDNYSHTSNSLVYLKMFSQEYKGEELYVNETACIDRNLVTASSTGGLLWAKYILGFLEVFPEPFLNSWYNYFATGDEKYYLEMLSCTQN